MRVSGICEGFGDTAGEHVLVTNRSDAYTYDVLAAAPQDLCGRW
jgi:hypothetical protein